MKGLQTEWLVWADLAWVEVTIYVMESCTYFRNVQETYHRTEAGWWCYILLAIPVLCPHQISTVPLSTSLSGFPSFLDVAKGNRRPPVRTSCFDFITHLTCAQCSSLDIFTRRTCRSIQPYCTLKCSKGYDTGSRFAALRASTTLWSAVRSCGFPFAAWVWLVRSWGSILPVVCILPN